MVTARLNLFLDLQMNIIPKINLIKIILAYSAMKIIANPKLPYSILNPETSSDSPSAKSNGVRFVSARHEISHTPTMGLKIINLYQTKLSLITYVRFNLKDRHI